VVTEPAAENEQAPTEKTFGNGGTNDGSRRLERVRAELESLAWARREGKLTSAQQDRYAKLCELEADLMRAS